MSKKKSKSIGDSIRLDGDAPVAEREPLVINGSSSLDDDNDLQDTIMTPAEQERQKALAVIAAKNADLQYVWTFPAAWEEYLAPFDDPITSFCQSFDGKIAFYFCLLFTLITNVEIGIFIPFLCYMIGKDVLATQYLYLFLVLCCFSQIPKRFMWRTRPYLAGRAKKVRNDMTSSFPSRAATCGVVFTYAIILACRNSTSFSYSSATSSDDMHINWYHVPILFAGGLVTGFARVNFGVHYASDILAGILQGFIITVLGTVIHRSEFTNCPSCVNNGCYSKASSNTLSFTNFESTNLLVLFGFSVLAFLLTVIAISPPVKLWAKAHTIFGFLLACITFRLSFLCPPLNHDSAALAAPTNTFNDPFSYVIAVIVCSGSTIVGVKGGKKPIFTFCLVYSLNLLTLIIWRLLR